MKDSSPPILLKARDFFQEKVDEALEQRKVKAEPLVNCYLVDLLEHYVSTDNLYAFSDEKGRRKTGTLAEMWLKALNSEPPAQTELLRRLGDSSLYISGFFGDSLKRKLVDIDYYVELGGSAYHTLSRLQEDGVYAQLFGEFSEKFSDFMDVLTYISQQSMVQNNEDLLRLYDRYLSTGSDLAREQLVEKGLLDIPDPDKVDQ